MSPRKQKVEVELDANWKKRLVVGITRNLRSLVVGFTISSSLVGCDFDPARNVVGGRHSTDQALLCRFCKMPIPAARVEWETVRIGKGTDWGIIVLAEYNPENSSLLDKILGTPSTNEQVFSPFVSVPAWLGESGHNITVVDNLRWQIDSPLFDATPFKKSPLLHGSVARINFQTLVIILYTH